MTPHEELKQLFADRKPGDVAIEISGYTGFRTTVVDDLTEDEAKQLLTIYCPSAESLDKDFNALKEEILKKEWKSNILAKAEKVKIKDKGDFQKFNNWMLLSSKFKKHLNAHSLSELKDLHQQLFALGNNNARSARKPLTKAWWDKGADNINLN